MRKILFICDPLHTFKVHADTTYLFMLTAAELDYQVFYTLPGQVYAENQIPMAIACEIKLLTTNQDIPGTVLPWYQENDRGNCNLKQFDIIMVRNDPPFNMEYFYLTQIMSLAEEQGVKVINNSHSLRNFNEKLSILNFPHLITPTIVTKNKEVIQDFLNTHNECVIKPLDLMAGRGVFKISPTEVNCGAIMESSTDYYTQSVMVQRFIPEVIYGDRRIFIVNGKVIDHCLYRIPQQNQIRGNIAAGGRGEVHPLTDEDKILASDVAKWLVKHDILLAGIDVIGNKLTEINITSPTGARQIYQQTGINIAALVFKALN